MSECKFEFEGIAEGNWAGRFGMMVSFFAVVRRLIWCCLSDIEALLKGESASCDSIA